MSARREENANGFGAERRVASAAAEEAVLGSLLLDARAWLKVADVVRAEDFPRPDHRLIFAAIATLARQEGAVDPVTVAGELERTEHLADAGGLAYLSNLMRETPTAENVLAYAQSVRDSAVRRRLDESLTHSPDSAELSALLDREAARLRPGSAAAPSVDGWMPPTVASYGADFDAATIPPRRWLLGRRRAIGEVTIDAGPPGVNKSMLLLTDAVAIVTGRPLLDDDVHQVGGVLLLVGEDARRDVEARLAGILAHYHIEPAELGGRLRVVYLAEVEPLTYSLARMMQDLVMLNGHMMRWLRECPDTCAVFIDPIAAWHQLIENNNEAQQQLGTALRALAAQSNRHVGFDHHVTKLAMSDPEAHVGNLAAIRGAGSIGAYARWAFTLAKLKPETANAHGIPDADRARYRRLDGLKASYGPDDEECRLLRVESVPIANGEHPGVLIEVDMQRTREDARERETAAKDEARGRLTRALALMVAQLGTPSTRAATRWLMTNAPELFSKRSGEPLSFNAVRDRLPTLIGSGLAVTHSGRHGRIVMREGTGPRGADEIAFEQLDLAGPTGQRTGQ